MNSMGPWALRIIKISKELKVAVTEVTRLLLCFKLINALFDKYKSNWRLLAVTKTTR